MSKRVAILQSNYIPWKGYFDMINMVDVFIFHDDLQYTKNDWRNRNKIKTQNGLRWLTIPCGTDEKRHICDVEIRDGNWQKKHWNLIQESYSKAPYFEAYREFFEHFYLQKKWTNLSELNQYLIKHIACEILGNHKTVFEDSQKYHLTKTKGERVMELLQKVDATRYLSGPAAKDYLQESDFVRENIQLEWMDYSEYPEYDQLYPPFEHSVSIIDLIFHKGPDACSFLKSTR